MKKKIILEFFFGFLIKGIESSYFFIWEFNWEGK